jgi:hypothetical protein
MTGQGAHGGTIRAVEMLADTEVRLRAACESALLTVVDIADRGTERYGAEAIAVALRSVARTLKDALEEAP